MTSSAPPLAEHLDVPAGVDRGVAPPPAFVRTTSWVRVTSVVSSASRTVTGSATGGASLAAVADQEHALMLRSNLTR